MARMVGWLSFKVTGFGIWGLIAGHAFTERARSPHGKLAVCHPGAVQVISKVPTKSDDSGLMSKNSGWGCRRLPRSGTNLCSRSPASLNFRHPLIDMGTFAAGSERLGLGLW